MGAMHRASMVQRRADKQRPLSGRTARARDFGLRFFCGRKKTAGSLESKDDDMTTKTDHHSRRGLSRRSFLRLARVRPRCSARSSAQFPFGAYVAQAAGPEVTKATLASSRSAMPDRYSSPRTRASSPSMAWPGVEGRQAGVVGRHTRQSRARARRATVSMARIS